MDKQSLLLFCVLIGLPVMAAFVRNWKLPFLLLFLYLPISGIVGIRVLGGPAGPLVKDLIFVAPAYLGFVNELRKKIRSSGIPQFYTVISLTFTALVLVHMFNPGVLKLGFGASLVGARVWLFYMPIALLTYVFLNSPHNIIQLLRTLTLTIWIACPVGLIQYFLARAYGYQKAMTWFFSDNARAVTQGFASFGIGTDGGSIMRIPATFTFVSQYSNFILGSIVFAFMLSIFDQSRKWKNFARLSLGLTIVAGFLCGSRGMVFYSPAALLGLLILHRGIKGMLSFFLLIFLVSALLSTAAGFTVFAAFGQFNGLIESYAKDHVSSKIVDAITTAPLGTGTGVNTFAARHFLTISGNSGLLSQSESQFAKACIELGIVGMLVYVVLLAIPMVVAVRCFLQFKDRNTKGAASACIIYFILTLVGCVKGQFLDIDPSNVHYWVFVGITFRLNAFRRAHENIAKQYSSAPRTSVYAAGDAADGVYAELPPGPSEVKLKTELSGPSY